MKFIPLAILVACLTMSIHASAQTNETGPEVYLPEERIAGKNDALIHPPSALGKTSAALQSFVSSNPGWQMYTPKTESAPHRAWGRGIQIQGYPDINLLNAESAARSFVAANTDILHADPANLRALYARMVNKKAYVKLIQQYQGLDVLFSYIDLRITDRGKVVMFGSDYHTGIDVNTTPSLTAESAKEFATFGLEYRQGTGNIDGGKLSILPVRLPTQVHYHLAYNFTVTTGEAEVWDTYVDAHDGKVLWRRNIVLQGHDDDENTTVRAAANIATGRIFVKVFNSDPRGQEEILPCPHTTIDFQGTAVTTDSEGRFSIDLGSRTSATGVARLNGPYAVAIRNDVINPNEEAIMAVPVTIDQESSHYFDDGNSISAERNGFYHTTLVSRWIRGIDGSANLIDTDAQMPVNVNDDSQSCNANWDGQGINFFLATSQCRNTATLPSVIYHEYGHAINTFLYQSLIGRRTFNGAIEEGNADITAALFLDDPRIGLGMYKGSGEGLLRNCDNTFRYPEDFSGQIHSDGRIIAGAVWDTRKLIGLEQTARLAHYVKYGTPDDLNYGIALADYFIEFLVADDDNADLSDGTPHSNEIIEAFRKHGIPASGITITHAEIANIQTSLQPYVFTGTATIGTEIAPDRIHISSVNLVYSDDNWFTSKSIEMDYDVASGVFQGTMPALKDGSIVRYYFEAKDNIGSMSRHPSPAPSAAYAFLVGYTTVEYSDMSSNPSWNVSGDATTGMWVREKPMGTYAATFAEPPDIPWVQPDEDHTAGVDSVCWVTGNTPADIDLLYLLSSADVDDGATILTTYDYSIAALKNPVLRYYRSYSNNSGSSPGEDEWVVQISDDGGATWNDLERTTESIANWTPRIFKLKDYVKAGTERFVLRFIAEDANPGSLVEAAIDDFEILDFLEPVAVEELPISNGIVLYQNYPNPFNPSTSLRFSVPSAQWVSLKVFDLLGNEVRTLVNKVVQAGATTIEFDGTTLPSGIYIYRLTTSAGLFTKRMMLTK